MHELASIYIHVGMEPHTDRQTCTHAGTQGHIKSL